MLHRFRFSVDFFLIFGNLYMSFMQVLASNKQLFKVTCLKFQSDFSANILNKPYNTFMTSTTQEIGLKFSF
jgi:hypothetical protein